MKLGILGTGVVGQTIGSKLAALGHDVKMGSRTEGNAKAKEWVAKASAPGGGQRSEGTFSDAAAFGELVWNCTNGAAALEILEAAGASNLRGKILIDLTNPLDFSKGFPPFLFTPSDDSLGERIQKALPETKVVKTLNTVSCDVMIDPGSVAGGDHDMFMSGNDAEAKARVTDILKGWFGWKRVIDLGDITNARGTEAWLPLWVRLYGSMKTGNFNIKVVR